MVRLTLRRGCANMYATLSDPCVAIYRRARERLWWSKLDKWQPTRALPMSGHVQAWQPCRVLVANHPTRISHASVATHGRAWPQAKGWARVGVRGQMCGHAWACMVGCRIETLTRNGPSIANVLARMGHALACTAHALARMPTHGNAWS